MRPAGPASPCDASPRAHFASKARLAADRPGLPGWVLSSLIFVARSFPMGCPAKKNGAHFSPWPWTPSERRPGKLFLNESSHKSVPLDRSAHNTSIAGTLLFADPNTYRILIPSAVILTLGETPILGEETPYAID